MCLVQSLFIPEINLHCLINLFGALFDYCPNFFPFPPSLSLYLCIAPLPQVCPKLVWYNFKLLVVPEFVQGDPQLALNVQGKALGF